MHDLGTDEASREGADPNSNWAQTRPESGKAIQAAIYDAGGKAVGQVDWKNRHGKGLDHGHGMATPGDFSSGRQSKGEFYEPGDLLDGWGDLPDGVDPIHD